METSARNVFSGTVSAIRSGAVNDEVELTVGENEKIVASITKASTERMGLCVGKKAIALIKATFVVLMSRSEDYILSTRNQFEGKVSKIIRGQVNAEVQIDVPNLSGITAVITLGSLDSMNLMVGSPVTAIVKAMHVMLAVPRA